jgi:arylsulfatase A-like enzyme
MTLRCLLLGITVAVAVLGCAVEDGQLNVILIGLDTVRPDHLGAYGYERGTSPRIDQLAAEGVLFENAVSQAPWTHPSFATVFTSLYPTQHGATTVGTRMSEGFPTLAGILGEYGYATGAVINAPSLSPKFGVNRGFDHYDILEPWSERPADVVTRSALEWIDLQHDQPFFLFVHYFDPHMPYAPAAPYDTLFDPDYGGTLGASFNIVGTAGLREEWVGQYDSWPDPDKDHIVALYDGEIAFADRAIGELIDGVAKRGLRDRTLVVFLSDHGEEFFDHGGLDHGHSLFDELIHVPLVVSLPGRISPTTRISQYVRLVDVMPTILDLLGLEQPPHLEGVSLKPLLIRTGTPHRGGERLLPPGICYAEALRHRITTKSLTAYPWKLIYDVSTQERLLFDLEADPGEQENLMAAGGWLAPAAETALADLDSVLTEALFRVSDTWFVEMAGGKSPHVFGFDIRIPKSRPPGHFRMQRLVGAGRDIRDIGAFEDSEITPVRITLSNLPVTDPVTLAIKTDIGEVALKFDLTIDGRPAVRRTFVGRELLRPVTMPFVEQVALDNEDLSAEPEGRPEPPYFLIWQYRSPYQGDSSIELDEEMRRELRALGYIQ